MQRLELAKRKPKSHSTGLFIFLFFFLSLISIDPKVPNYSEIGSISLSSLFFFLFFWTNSHYSNFSEILVFSFSFFQVIQCPNLYLRMPRCELVNWRVKPDFMFFLLFLFSLPSNE